MTTIIIDENTKKGKIILEIVREMNAGKIIDEKKHHSFSKETLQAIEEAKTGKTVKCNSFDDYLEKVK
jgi:hypothetical protein